MFLNFKCRVVFSAKCYSPQKMDETWIQLQWQRFWNRTVTLLCILLNTLLCLRHSPGSSDVARHGRIFVILKKRRIKKCLTSCGKFQTSVVSALKSQKLYGTCRYRDIQRYGFLSVPCRPTVDMDFGMFHAIHGNKNRTMSSDTLVSAPPFVLVWKSNQSETDEDIYASQ